MDSCRKHFRRLKLMLAIGSTVVAAGALAAPVVVTPTDLQGWLLADGSSGTSPAAITGAQPDAGNGSIQLMLSVGNQQPLAALGFGSAITLGRLLNSDMTFGYSWLVPVGAPANTSPTIRLLLSGVTGAGQTNRSDGSLGWYMNTVGDGAFHTSTFSMTSGDFFFRVGGVGQESLGCNSAGSSFDDRRQTLAAWDTTCTGAGGTANIDNATVVGIEVDFGTLPGNTTTQSVFADLINFSIGGNVGSFNFETSAAAAAVPEPESMALMLLGLGVALGASARGRRARRAGASAPGY